MVHNLRLKVDAVELDTMFKAYLETNHPSYFGSMKPLFECAAGFDFSDPASDASLALLERRIGYKDQREAQIMAKAVELAEGTDSLEKIARGYRAAADMRADSAHEAGVVFDHMMRNTKETVADFYDTVLEDVYGIQEDRSGWMQKAKLGLRMVINSGLKKKFRQALEQGEQFNGYGLLSRALMRYSVHLHKKLKGNTQSPGEADSPCSAVSQHLPSEA